VSSNKDSSRKKYSVCRDRVFYLEEERSGEGRAFKGSMKMQWFLLGGQPLGGFKRVQAESKNSKAQRGGIGTITRVEPRRDKKEKGQRGRRIDAAWFPSDLAGTGTQCFVDGRTEKEIKRTMQFRVNGAGNGGKLEGGTSRVVSR